MVEENISQEFRLKNKDETKYYLIEKINRNELMSKRDIKGCTTLNYIEHFLILSSTITVCVFSSSFASLVSIPIVITSSVIGLNTCAINPGIKKYKSIIKEKNRKHDKIFLLAKSKLNSIAVLRLYPIQLLFMMKEYKKYNQMKEEIKNLKT